MWRCISTRTKKSSNNLDFHYDTQVERIQHIRNQQAESKTAPNKKEFESVAKHISKYSSPKTLEEVGKELNVTRERIRQIEAKTIRKFKPSVSSSKAKILRDFFKG
jgi:RNA polymerase primary sigma factor